MLPLLPRPYFNVILASNTGEVRTSPNNFMPVSSDKLTVRSRPCYSRKLVYLSDVQCLATWHLRRRSFLFPSIYKLYHLFFKLSRKIFDFSASWRSQRVKKNLYNPYIEGRILNFLL